MYSLTDDLEVPLPVDHGVGVDLAHVPTAVRLLRTLHVEVPLLWRRPREGDARVPGDDVVVDRQDSLRVNADPCNLRTCRQRRRIQFSDSVRGRVN